MQLRVTIFSLAIHCTSEFQEVCINISVHNPTASSIAIQSICYHKQWDPWHVIIDRGTTKWYSKFDWHHPNIGVHELIYLIPIKICAPLDFAPLIFAPLIFAHPYFTVNLPFFHSFVVFFLLPLIFAHSYCARLLSLIFAQARCANIKEARILMGIR